MAVPKISVSIVCFHDEKDALTAVRSLLDTHGADMLCGIYLIDNAAFDGSDTAAFSELRAMSPLVHCMRNRNEGYGRGNNRALRYLDSDYHIIMNPDVYIEPDALGALTDFMESHKDCMLAAPKMLGTDGELLSVYRRDPTVYDMALRRFFLNLNAERNAYHEMADQDYTKPFEVPFMQGSFLFVRTGILKKIKGFDPRYFLYMEDADLCRTIRKEGKILYCPDAVVTHAWQRSSGKSIKMFALHVRSMTQYFIKWNLTDRFRRGKKNAANERSVFSGYGRISVVMPVYNGEKYLPEQLDSILACLGTDDELLLSDDGSADGSAAILADYAGRFPQIRILQGPGRGVKANVSAALSGVKGDIIFLSDQDDVWFPEKKDRVLAAFSKTGADIVVHDAVVTGEDGKTVLLPSYFAHRGCGAGVVKNIVKNTYIGCCMAFTKDVLPCVLPVPETIEMHDQWIGVRAELRGFKAYFLPEPLIYYRRHGENASSLSHYPMRKMIRNRAALVMALLKAEKR